MVQIYEKIFRWLDILSDRDLDYGGKKQMDATTNPDISCTGQVTNTNYECQIQ